MTIRAFGSAAWRNANRSQIKWFHQIDESIKSKSVKFDLYDKIKEAQ